MSNLIWNVATFRTLGHFGLALGTSIAALANFSVLAFAFQRQIGGLFARDLLVPFVRILGASAVMAVAVWAVSRAVERLGGGGTTVYLIQALTPIGVGGIVYFAAARLLGVDESRMLVRRFRR